MNFKDNAQALQDLLNSTDNKEAKSEFHKLHEVIIKLQATIENLQARGEKQLHIVSTDKDYTYYLFVVNNMVVKSFQVYRPTGDTYSYHDMRHLNMVMGFIKKLDYAEHSRPSIEIEYVTDSRSIEHFEKLLSQVVLK